MNDELRLRGVFYKTEHGNEPVREWLKSLPQEDRKTIGEDVKTVQFGWPIGMPVCENWAKAYGKFDQHSKTVSLAYFSLLKVK
jgi:hypothetical protein